MRENSTFSKTSDYVLSGIYIQNNVRYMQFYNEKWLMNLKGRDHLEDMA
jgi:hypothetical protein